jgi:hypothetical protein
LDDSGVPSSASVNIIPDRFEQGNREIYVLRQESLASASITAKLKAYRAAKKRATKDRSPPFYF